MSSASSRPAKRRPAKPRATSTKAGKVAEPVAPAAKDEADDMRDEYDFSNALPNPYAAMFPKQSITIRLEVQTLMYFKNLADQLGVPYQSLINFYLRDCAIKKRQPDWG